MSALAALARRLGRDTTLYGTGSFVLIALGLINVVVLTRLLAPQDFGRLAVLLVISELLPLLYNLASLQGGLGLAFGAGLDDGEDGEEELAEGRAASTLLEKRLALGTAVVFTAVVAAAGTVAIALLAEPLAGALLDDEVSARAVVVAAGAGALYAIFRPVSIVPRYERRPMAFSLLQSSRVVLGLAAVIPIVSAGGGVEGAITGVLAGNAAAAALALWVTRRNYRLSLRPAMLAAVLRRGRRYVPVTLSAMVVKHADVLILAQFAPARDVGLYRLATRAATVVSFPISAFLTAWMTLVREPVHAAASAERGGNQGVATSLLTYFVFATAGMLLVVVVAADVLVRIAPASYRDAAGLIPLVAAGFVAHGWYVVLYRAARFPHKLGAFISLAVVAAAVTIAVALLLIPGLGARGAALAVLAGPLLAGTVLFALSQRGPHPVALDYPRIALAVVAATALGGLERLVAQDGGPWRTAVAAAVLVAYPLILLRCGGVPESHRKALRALWRDRRSEGAFERDPLYARLDSLELGGIEALEQLIKERRPLALVAQAMEIGEDELIERFVRALRGVALIDGGEDTAADVGRYLLSDAPIAHRDDLARRLWASGVDPLEVDTLARTIRRLRRTPRRSWRPRPQPPDLRALDT